MVKGFNKLSYETKSKKLNIYSLDRRRLRSDLIETFKIIIDKEHVNSSTFSQLLDVTSRLRGHSLKLFKRDAVQQSDRISLVHVSSMNGTSWMS